MNGCACLSLQEFNLTVLGNMTFTVGDMVAHLLPIYFRDSLVLLFTFITVITLIGKLRSSLFLAKRLKSLKEIEGSYARKVCNLYLISFLKKTPLKIVVSPTLQGSPFVLGLFSYILFIPQSLLKSLSQKEYEAALAHEIEHVRYKDSLVRLILTIITSIFWWVPTGWLINRIEEGQEIGCDIHSAKYGVEPIDLASAICKSAKESSFATFPLFVSHLLKKSLLRWEESICLS